MENHWYKTARAMGYCCECGADLLAEGSSEYYMLVDPVWAQAGFGNNEACIGCVEKALGRELNHHDFQRIMLNFHEEDTPPFQSERLKDRLSRGAPLNV